jgi:hypothetical protein
MKNIVRKIARWRARGLAHVAEHLSSKHEALSSNLSTVRGKKTK